MQLFCLGPLDVQAQNNPAPVAFTVGGGDALAPFFTFTDSTNSVPDFLTRPLYRGVTYIFTAENISSSHPFMIGESYGDTDSVFVSGGPMTGSGDTIIVSIPTDFEGSLFYFCTNHQAMIQEFSIVSLGAQYEVIDLNWSDSDKAFRANQESFPNFQFFSNCYYNFTNHSSQSLVLSTSPDITSLGGSFVFNNGNLGPDNYLLFVPKLAGSEEDIFYYYNPDDNENYGLIEIVPYRQKQLLQAPSPQLEGRFGYSLCVTSGNQIVVGAYGEDSLEGIAYVYNRLEDLSHSFSQEIKAPLEHQSNRMKFGASVASVDNYLVVSAPDSNAFEGEVFFYQKDEAGQYIFIQKIESANPASGDSFGFGLSMSPQWVAASSLQYGDGNGEVSIFEIDSTLTFQSTIQASDGMANDNFGYDLDIKDNIIVVGAPGAGDAVNGLDSGASYIFETNDFGVWVETQKIAPSTLSAGDRFGCSVRISENFIFVGAVKGDDDGVDTGVVYIFEKIEGVWTEVALVSPPTSTANQLFSTDLQSSGDLLISSAPGAGSHGMVYVYQNLETSHDWVLISSLDLNQSTVLAGASTYLPVATQDGMIFVGSPEESSLAVASGGVQSFFNPAWAGTIEQPSLAPLLDSATGNTFLIQEDSLGFTYDFNASHPFDLPIIWTLEPESIELGEGFINETTGIFQFSPFDNQSGSQRYIISLSVGNFSVSHTIEITIAEVNDPPVFTDLSTPSHTLPVAMVGESFEFLLKVEDIDGTELDVRLKDGDILPAGLSLVEGNEIGEYAITGSPSGEFLSFADGVHIHSFSLVCDDGSGDSPVEQRFSLKIFSRNETPKVFFNGIETSTITLALHEDFKAEDWLDAMNSIQFDDPNGGNLNLTLLQPPIDGEISLLNEALLPQEHIIFTPQEHSNGDRSFQVRITDDDPNFPKYTDLTINLHIESVNDPPSITSSLPLSHVNEGDLYSHTFEIFDPDDSDIITFNIYGLPDWMSYSEDTLSITGTPSWSDYNDGLASTIFVTVEDDYGSKLEQSYAIFVIPENYPPLIIGDESLIYNIDEDQSPVAWPSVILSSFDPDGTVSSFEWSTISGPSHGLVMLEDDGNRTSVFYRPDGNFSGIDNFTISVSEENDSNASDFVTFTVIVRSIEDDPVFKSTPHYTDAIVEYPWEYKIDTEDGDDGQQLSLFFESPLPPWISVLDSQEGGAILRGIAPAGAEGEYPINLRVRDDQSNTATQSFILRVLSQNTTPVLTLPSDNVVIINEDEVWKSEGARILDPEKQKIATLINIEPNHGELKVNVSLEKEIDIEYTPDGNYTGTDKFSIIFTDGINSDQATFEVLIEPVEDTPVFSNLPANIILSDDDDLNITFNINDGDSLEGIKFDAFNAPEWVIFEAIDLPGGIVKLAGSPTYEDAGKSSITFTIEDATQRSNSHHLLIDVIVNNYPPQVDVSEYNSSMIEDLPESWTPLTFSASDDHTLTKDLNWKIAISPSNGSATIKPDGSHLIYQPDSNFSGVDLFTIEVIDTGGVRGSLPKSSKIEIRVDVNNTSDEPVFKSSPPTDQVDFISWTDESPYYYRIVAYDADGTPPTISCLSTLPSWLKFTTDENGSALLSGLASPADIGRYQLKFEATDGITTVEQAFELVIRVDNYPPTFYSTLSNSPVKKVRVFIDEDGTGAKGWNPPTSFACYDPDPNELSQEISWAVGKVPLSGSNLLVDGSGLRPATFLYSPKHNLNGYDEFTLEASDGIRKAELKFEVYIRAVPDKPYFVKPTSSHFQFQGGDQFNIEILAQDDDSAELSYKLFLPAWLDPGIANIRLAEEEAGVILRGEFPEEGKEESIPVTVSAVDENGAFDMIHFNLQVNGSNRSPIIQAGDEMTIVFSRSGGIISANLDQLKASDPDEDLLFWEIKQTDLPKNGEVSVLASDGVVNSLSYDPNFIGPGTDSFTLLVTDGKKNDEILIKAIIVEDNDPPVISGDSNISIGPSEFLAIDFLIVHSGTYYTSFITEGPDWFKLEEVSSKKLRLTGHVPATFTGVHNVSFKVISSNGLSSVMSVAVTVANNLPPEIQLLGEKFIQLNTDENFSEPGYFAKDNRGSDLTGSVIMSTEGNLSKPGISKLTYEVSDAGGHSVKDFRFVQIYDKSPLEFSHAIYANSSDGLHALLSTAGTFILAGSINERIKVIDKTLGAAEVQVTGENLLVGELDANLRKWLWTIELAGQNVQVSRLISKGSFLYAAGVFSGKLRIDDKSISSDHPHSTFLAKLTAQGDIVWVKTFGSSNETEQLQIYTSSDLGILFGGSFRDKIYINESTTVESYDEASDIFLLHLSSSGDILRHSIFGRSGSNILSDISFSKNGVLISSNVLKPGSSPYGLTLGLNSELKLNYSVSFESSNFSECKNLLVDGTDFYLTCNYSHSLKMKTGGDDVQKIEKTLTSSEQNSSVVLKFSSDLGIIWQQELPSKKNSFMESIELTPFGNIMALVSFDQDSITHRKGELSIPRDYLIVKLQQMNGDVIWTKDILGDGYEVNASLLMNQYGATAMKIHSDRGLIIDSNELNQTSPTESLLMKFESGSPIHFKQINDLTLMGGEFFTQRISLENRKFAEFRLVNAPSFITLQNAGDGVATVSGLVPNFEINGTVVVQAFDADGSSSQLSFDYQIKKNFSLSSSKDLPAYHSTKRIKGDGQIIDIIDLENHSKLIVGNAVSSLSYEGFELKKGGLRYGFILLTDPNLGLMKMIAVNSSNEAVISSVNQDETGAIMISGTFKEDLYINDQRYFGSDYYNVFIAELSVNGNLSLVETFSSNNDLLSLSVTGNQESFTASGQMWGGYSEGVSSNGLQDGFLAQFSKNQLQLFHPIGGSNMDEVIGHIPFGDETVISGNFDKLFSWGGKLYNEQGKSSFITKLESNGAEGKLTIIPSTGIVRGISLKYNSTEKAFFLAGEFTGTISIGNHKVESLSGLDIFIARFDHDLTCSSLLSYGGEGTDRLTDFKISRDGELLFSATFEKQFYPRKLTESKYDGPGSYLAKLDPESLLIQDYYIPRELGTEKINSISPIRQNNVLFSYVDKKRFEDKTINIASLGSPINKPGISKNLPLAVSSNSFFTFPFTTGPWTHGSTIDTENVNLPSWIHLEVEKDGKGSLSGQPPYSEHDITYDINFDLTNNQGEELRINHPIIVKKSSLFKPRILLENEYSFKQFDDIEIWVHIFDPDGDSFVMHPNLPDWLTYSNSQSNKLMISGTALREKIGNHEISILAVDSSGLTTEKTANILIQPYLGENTIDTSELAGGWSRGWIGDFLPTSSGWSFHTTWGWVWLYPEQHARELWFQVSNGNWYWTNSVYWDAVNNEGYLYRNQDRLWLYCRFQKIGQSIQYDYTKKEWSSFP